MDRKIGVMLDCSRNAVMSVSGLKRFIGLLAKMGYNRFMLYTEDTYEIESEPLFGYMRGRYSGTELKEIDAFCSSLGVELIPCIQTLAHLNQIFTWGHFSNVRDINDILLVDEDKTYELIDKMFESCAKNFTARKIHIGMDEAHKLGLGKYLDKHGFCNRYDILIKHLNKVCEIASKYGFEPMMWSDMFFSLAFDGKYYVFGDEEIPQEIKNLVPKNVELIYWDYYTNTEENYSSMIRKHLSFNRNVSFAGGAWTWEQFTPRNNLSIMRTEQAMRALNKYGVKDILMTIWGDNGSECPAYAVLPTLFYTAECTKGNFDIDVIKQKFFELVGVPWDDFMSLDMYLSDDLKKSYARANGIKTMFYSDPFVGRYDSTVTGTGVENKEIKKFVDIFTTAKNRAGEYAYIFDSYAKLADFMSIKYDLGFRTRAIYQSGDKAKLSAIISDYDLAIQKLNDFYTAFKNLWFENNKAFGFEITDIRIGGLKQRLNYAKNKLMSYINGEISVIEELELKLVDCYGGSEMKKHILECYPYSSSASVNRL